MDDETTSNPSVTVIDGRCDSSRLVRVQTATEVSAVPPPPSRERAGSAWRRALQQAHVGGFRTRAADAEMAAWTGDQFPGSVDAVEIHFVYPFSIEESSENGRPVTASKDPVNGLLSSFDDVEIDGRDNHCWLFGDDGHLQFKEVVKTVEVKSVVIEPESGGNRLLSSSSVESDGRKSRGAAGLRIPMFQCPSTSPLPLTLRDKHGNMFNLNQVFIKVFSFNVGILRFAIMAQSKVDVQAVLDVQNAVMRLDDSKQAGRLSIIENEEDKGLFLPKVFIRKLLNERFQGKNWKADESTDRLFTFTLAGISQLKEEKEVKMAAYNIGQMEWDAAAAVDERYVDEFRDNNVYTRYASPNGGLWSCFHPDGGCVLFFMEKSNELPLWGYSRLEKKKVSLFGSSRVLVAFSLIEVVVFQRMYLRNLDQRLSKLIMSDKHDRHNLLALKRVHGELLRFRTKFNSTPISAATAGKQQFHVWASVVGLRDMTSSLLETVKDLHEYYNDIEEKASQQRLDMLAVVLGFLGVAQLVSDIFWAYWNEGGVRSTERDLYNAIVPSSFAFFLFVAAVVFLVVTRRQTH
eukprot:m.103520 g.103520  ORF g.103520 m.103520 type:complete len:575 (+) comp37191_c0_seq29:104-1828(+)